MHKSFSLVFQKLGIDCTIITACSGKKEVGHAL